MTRRLLVPVVLAAAFVAATVGAQAATPTNECNGIRECQRVWGPWVVVPAHGVARYMLECFRRKGVVAGLDAAVTTDDVHASFEGQLSAPISPGRTTTTYAFFTAQSVRHRRGLFQPRLGCVLPRTGGPSTVSYHLSSAARHAVAPRTTTAVHALPGPPFQLAATNFELRPGTLRTATIACVPGQKLVDSWTAVAFRTVKMPSPGLADAVTVKTKTGDKNVSITIATSEALPPGSKAEVQLGVKCSVL